MGVLVMHNEEIYKKANEYKSYIDKIKKSEDKLMAIMIFIYIHMKLI